jgi:hypothetical protein
MKTRMLLIMLLSVFTMACHNSSSSPDTTTTPPLTVVYGTSPGAPGLPIPPGCIPYDPANPACATIPGAPAGAGASASFVFDSALVYNQYVSSIRHINTLAELSNIAMTLNLQKVVQGSTITWGGTVKIGYNWIGQPGQLIQGYFTSGNDAASTTYNQFFTPTGALTPVFHGFFEDFLGGLIVVIDQTASLADGVQAADTVSGSIWFKNYGYTWQPHPANFCWFILGGPFDCRAWKTSTAVNTFGGVTPDGPSGYTRLGTFTNLNLEGAVNNGF